MQPGVYVEEDPTPLVTIIGATPNLVAVVGPARGYQIHTEAVTLTGTTAVTLARLGIDIVNGFEVRASDGTLFVGDDYDIVEDDIGETGVQDDETTIARSDTSTITDGATVYVTYRYTDVDYTQPFLVNDYDTVKDVFGEPFDFSTGAILSPLSLAAKVVLENGASRVLLVATPTPLVVTREELQDGLNKLTTQPGANIVVTLPVGLTGTEGAPGDILNVIQDLEAHVTESSDNDQQYRVGIIGYEGDVTTLPLSIAAAASSKRVMLAWPNKLLFYNGFTNQVITVAGYYLAAAMAGRMSAQPPQLPLTQKQIRSFSGLPADVLNTQTVTAKNALSAGGVAVVEFDRNQRLIVRHGVSTDPSTVDTREISLVRQRDAMMRIIQDTIEATGLIGSTIDLETPARVKGVVAGCLETSVNSGLIVAYNSLLARQRTDPDPTVIEVKWQYRPAYPLNYIVAVYSLNTLTGEQTIQ